MRRTQLQSEPQVTERMKQQNPSSYIAGATTPGTNEASMKVGVIFDLSLMSHCVQGPSFELKSNIYHDKRQTHYNM